VLDSRAICNGTMSDPPIVADADLETAKQPLTRWQRIENVIWDGGDRTQEERALVRRLDIFIM
jgi:ACS family pantothenate transporter-like MFS transporter